MFRSIWRFHAMIFLVTMATLCPQVRSQIEPQSIEALLAEATENAKKETDLVEAKVKTQIRHLKSQGKGAKATQAAARTRLAQLGFGAIAPLVSNILKSKDGKFLHQISLVFAEMFVSKTAKLSDIAPPLRDVIDSQEPLQSSVAIETLGYIGDQKALDAIRLQGQRKSIQVQASVLVARARLSDETIFEDLRAAAQHEEAELRKAAAEAFGIVGRNPQDQKTMVALIGDENKEVALLAIKSLGRISTNSRAMSALHDMLTHEDPDYIATAIKVIKKIGRKEYSGRHLLNVVKRRSLDLDLRKSAALALMGLGGKDGMLELAKPLRAAVKAQPKAVRPQEALANFYVEFGAWEMAAKAYSRALEVSRRGGEQNDLRLEIARCWARADRFKKAARSLKESGRESSWQDLVDDPAFAKMREDKRYRRNFYD